MQTSFALEKSALRKHMQAQRDALALEQRTAWSASVCQHALALPAYQTARVVHCFLSIQSELDTRLIIEHSFAHGKRVVIPVFRSHSTETACCEITSLADEHYKISGFGLRVPRVMCPVELSAIDLVFVPLLAFAPRSSNPETDGGSWLRLGYGAGYYDIFLRRLSPGTPKIGVAFEMQRVAQMPQEPHDTLLDDVITEHGLARI